MLTFLRPLRRFWSPGPGACRLARNAPVLALAMLVAAAASFLQSGSLMSPVQGGRTASGPLSALDQSVQDFFIRAQAPGPLTWNL